MKLRKFTNALLSLIIVFTLTSCSNTRNESKNDAKIEVGSSASTEKDSLKANVPSESPSEKDNKNEDVESNKIYSNESKKQVPLNNKTIVLDPGHASSANLEKEKQSPESSIMKIKDGGGAEGAVTKTPEYKICMNVALKLKDELKAKGFNVIMTKEDNSLSLGNIERTEIGNKNNANLVVRIHADSADVTSAKGASILVPEPINSNTKAIYEQSKNYGKTIIDIFCEETKAKNRGISQCSDMTGFNWSKVPVVLVEMGFLSNPDEDKLLSSKDYQDKCAEALAKAIEKCFDSSKNK